MLERNIVPLTVRQLNIYAKSLLENDPRLAFCRVSGEVSNFKRHYASGHLYFTLSDGFAAIKCVMFRSYADRCKLELKDGIRVVVSGRVSIYEKDGGYQLYAEAINEDGIGDKLLALKLLKEKLAAEGLFDADSKREIPAFPKSVAVVTSGTGAALQDILNIISRRFPVCNVVLCSASVQGMLAPKELINALDRVYSVADSIDTVIIGRGGGSSEDLDAFNDEALARKIYASPIPVISAVGHQTDLTICDMVADLRAPTPSAAAELAVPDKIDLIERFANLAQKSKISLLRKTELYDTRLQALLSRSALLYPTRMLDEKSVSVDKNSEKIVSLINLMLEKSQVGVHGLISKIEALSPMKTMARGFAFAEKNSIPISSLSDVNLGDNLKLYLSDGKIDCTVINKENNNDV